MIVDSSPLLAVTDGAILAANSDGALIMARYGQTKREQLAQAIGNLRDVGATVLGAAFTMTSTRGSAYSYSYGYYGDERHEPTRGDVLPAAKRAADSDRAPLDSSELPSFADGKHRESHEASARDGRSGSSA